MTRKAILALTLLSLLVLHAPASRRNEPDWTRVGDEAIQLLSDYLKVDTSNPPGNEERAAEFFARILDREGIEYQILRSAPGRANLYARLRGSGGNRPLILLNHMDVVPVDREFWTVDPFAGEVRGGYIWGRGALDMKSLGAAQFMTLVLLKRFGVELDRDVIFLGTADEEAGGADGAGWMVKHHPELIRDAEFLLNEGSSNYVVGDRVIYYGIGTTEKTPSWLRLTARGPAGHGSVPRKESAPSRLLRALGKLEAYESPVKVTTPVARYFASMAEFQTGPDLRRAYSDVAAAMNDRSLRSLILSVPQNSALLRNTIQPTVVSIGSKTNVIPTIATAEIDCRLLPGENPADFVAEIKRVIADPTIEVEVLLGFAATESSLDTDLFRAIEKVIRTENAQARFVPTVLAGFTDSHFFRKLGMVSYGFSPFLIQAGDFNGIHGNDERIPVEAYRGGIRRLYRIVHGLCAANP